MNDPGGPAAARVAEVIADVVSRGPRGSWLNTLVADCRGAAEVDGVGLVVADSAGPVGVAAVTPGAGQLAEELQFTLGEGPGRTASSTGRTVRVPDLAADERWPLFAREASIGGLAAAFCVPLQVGAAPVGVLDVYRCTPGQLTDVEQAVVDVYGEVAVGLLLLLGPGQPGTGVPEDLAELVDLRPVVHQAAGMVAVQLEVDLMTAMLRLRAHAFVAGRALREVAADVVERRLRFDDGATDDDPGGGRR